MIMKANTSFMLETASMYWRCFQIDYFKIFKSNLIIRKHIFFDYFFYFIAIFRY